MRKFLISLAIEAQNHEKGCHRRKEGRFSGLGGIVIGRQMQGAIKYEDRLWLAGIFLSGNFPMLFPSDFRL